MSRPGRRSGQASGTDRSALKPKDLTSGQKAEPGPLFSKTASITIGDRIGRRTSIHVGAGEDTPANRQKSGRRSSGVYRPSRGGWRTTDRPTESFGWSKYWEASPVGGIRSVSQERDCQRS